MQKQAGGRKPNAKKHRKSGEQLEDFVLRRLADEARETGKPVSANGMIRIIG